MYLDMIYDLPFANPLWGTAKSEGKRMYEEGREIMF